MTIVSLILTALLTLPSMSDHNVHENNSFPALPDSIDGWKVADTLQWDRNTLYEYIDGGAELFLSYSFEGAQSRSYVRADQPDIIVDVFRFTRSEDAYGVYSMSREDENTAVGAGGQYGAGLLLFWKDRYYISILASPETPAARDAVMSLARMSDEEIEGATAAPELPRRFPSAGLRPGTMRYFLHHAWQNVYGFISNDDILHIGDSAEAAVAKYRIGEEESALFLIHYRDHNDAQRAYDAWRRHFGVQPNAMTVVREDQWFAAACTAQFLALVHWGTDETVAQALLENALDMLK
mgnify:CR=1 FL=1